MEWLQVLINDDDQLGYFLGDFRGGAVAVESSGMPTVPNNLRTQTPDKSVAHSDNRRVRVSDDTHKQTDGRTKPIQIRVLFPQLECVFCV